MNDRNKTTPSMDSVGVEVQPDVTPRREGGDDALAEASPTDSRADEKVLVNDTKEAKEKDSK